MKIRISLFLISAVVGLIGGFLILNSNLQASATGDFLVRLGKGLVYGMGALVLVFSVLFFIPRAFSAWKKFAIWFVPLAALLFIVYPEPGSGDYFSPYPEQVFQWVSAFYVLVSLTIIVIAALRRRDLPKTP